MVFYMRHWCCTLHVHIHVHVPYQTGIRTVDIFLYCDVKGKYIS